MGKPRSEGKSSGGRHSAPKKVMLMPKSKLESSGERRARSGESSGGQHSAGKWLKVMPDSELKSSGSLHSADDFSLLLLDEDNFAPGIRARDLVYDPRMRLDQEELEELLLEK